MAKKGDEETVSTMPDAAARAQRAKVYGAGNQVAQQPYSPYTGQEVAGASDLSSGAAEGYQQGAGLFGLGVNAIGGDQAAFKKFMDPYQENVLDSIQSQAQRSAHLARNDIGDQATMAGAFGGSRHGVAEGVATGDIMRGADDRMADYTSRGFGDAQQRAFQAANLGFGSLNAQQGMGDYFRRIQQQYLDTNRKNFDEARDWDVRNLGILQSSMSGVPVGQTQSQPSASNPLMGAAGGAMSGYAAAGAPGAIVGGLFGGLS